MKAQGSTGTRFKSAAATADGLCASRSRLTVPFIPFLRGSWHDQIGEAEHLSQVLRLPKGRSELVLDAVFDSLEKALCRDERIEIRGFGSFEIRHYRARQGRNPRTGASVEVKPKRLPYFKVGKELRARVAKGVRATREVDILDEPQNLKITAVEIPSAKF